MLEQFLMLFSAVRNAASDEPSRVTTFYEQHEPLTTAVNKLFMFMSFGDFERRVFHSPKKYHPQTPQGFEQTFRDYKKNWERPISDAVFPTLVDLLEFDMGERQAANELSALEPEVEAPDPEFEERFDPLFHDGGKAVPMAFLAAESYANSTDDFSDMHYASKIGLEAYDYLTDTIGLDVDDIFRRWRNIPTIFMPAHVSDAHGLTERGSLYDLIDDAVRAYVFGAPAAAVATCRAALEMVLKRHYDVDYQFKGKHGHIRDRGLGDLIILADEKYEFVQGKRLERLTREANDVMHNYSRRNPMSEKDEQSILDFLKTIKFLIERAPAG